MAKKPLPEYMKQNLLELYAKLDSLPEFAPEWDFVSGSIETTQHYLSTIGEKYPEYEEYLEDVTLNWKRRK